MTEIGRGSGVFVVIFVRLGFGGIYSFCTLEWDWNFRFLFFFMEMDFLATDILIKQIECVVLSMKLATLSTNLPFLQIFLLFFFFFD